ncbi:MAG: hypothetical protein AAGH90_10910 [Pseudomonadota bacterium]
MLKKAITASIVALGLQIGLAQNAVAGPYDLRCKAGGDMVFYYDMKCGTQRRGSVPALFSFLTQEGIRQKCHVAPRFWFKPASTGADQATLKPGECAWPHRALNRSEKAGQNGQGLVAIHIKHEDRTGLTGFSLYSGGETKARYSSGNFNAMKLVQKMQKPGTNFTMQVSYRTYDGQRDFDHAYDNIGRGLTGKRLWLEKTY